ncbi:MAG: hypothetical protein R6V55_16240 [Desulfovermiculus sp.]
MQVHIEMAGSKRTLFHPLLREGVQVQVRLGGTVRDILHQDLHIPEQIVDQEIQSLFLDNHPVDDLETRIHTPGSVLSLSAAMPGLVGACMRRGGAYAGLRQGISWDEEAEDKGVLDQGLICVKLFNFMAPRIGPILLAQGVRVDAKRLVQLLAGASKGEGAQIASLQVGAESMDVFDPMVKEALAGVQAVWLQVDS